mmetsp:Transcript_746/g.1953  ORF Transcript_746/g.1953 Transcript_746/m.1953 type:complete len:208 (+) Transcript_746:218-841(+)
MLVEPKLPELKALLGIRMPPPVLLGKLREAGINLSPTDRDAAPLHANLTPKWAVLEEKALRELLLLSCEFKLANSKWNVSRAPDKVTVRIMPNLPKDEDDDLFSSAEPKIVDHFAANSEEGWQTMLYAHRYAALILSGEADANIALDVHGKELLAKHEVAHGSPMNCLKERHPDLSNEILHTSAHYMSQLRQLLGQLRLLSFTAGSN